MAIQMRRGQMVDFDPSKMLPGEWAVSVDEDTNKRFVWMCFAPGQVKRMGTYEDFKAYNDIGTGLLNDILTLSQKARFEVDPSTGHLLYYTGELGTALSFSVDQSTGHLMWEATK